MNIRFEAFLARHGEYGIQAILENWERYRGIKHPHTLPLERRWEIFMRETAEPAQVAA